MIRGVGLSRPTGSRGGVRRKPPRDLILAAARKETDAGQGSGENVAEKRRISTNNTSLSLKKQLRQVEKAKSVEEGKTSLKPLPRTKFRQRRPSKDGEKEEELFSQPDDVQLHDMSLLREKKVGQSQLFIVDAYNVCGAWPELKGLFHSGQIEKCRKILIEELSYFRETEIVAVFDATTASSSRPAEEMVNEWLKVVYVSDADEYIDREVSKLATNKELDIWVVTSDNLTRSLAGTAGASLVSSLEFGSYFKGLKSKDKASNKILSMQDQYRGQLRFALNPSTRKQLEGMRTHLRDVPLAVDNEAGEGVEERDGGDGEGEEGKRETEGSKKKRKKPKAKPILKPVLMGGHFSTHENGLMAMRNKLSPPPPREEVEEEEGEEEPKVELVPEKPHKIKAAEKQEKDECNLYVGFIPRSMKESNLRSLFETYGSVRECKLILDRETGQPKGFGFVKMADKKSAKAAIESLDGHQVGGKRIKVANAKGGKRKKSRQKSNSSR